MNRFVYALFVCFALLSVREVYASEKIDVHLAEMRAKIRTLKSYAVDFKTVDDKGSELMKGAITVLNNKKYHLKTKFGEMWFDGKTLWNYSSENNEVTIDESQGQNNILANPQKLLSLDSENIVEAISQGKEHRNGRNVNITRVVLSNDGVDFIIMLYIDEITKLPSEMNITSKDGDYKFNIIVEKFDANISVGDEKFKFDSKKFPGVEIIDFR